MSRQADLATVRAAFLPPMLIGAAAAAYVFCAESRHDPPRGVGGWARRSIWGVGCTALGAVVGGVATVLSPLWAPIAAVEGLRRWAKRTPDKTIEDAE